MSFDWTDFLALAEKLSDAPQTPGPEEACLRSSVSRAYYAMFKTVLSFAETETGYEPREYGSDHVALPLHLQDSSDGSCVDIGIKLDRLRLNRRQADYDDKLKHDPRKLAQMSVKTAQRIVELMGNQSGS